MAERIPTVLVDDGTDVGPTVLVDTNSDTGPVVLQDPMERRTATNPCVLIVVLDDMGPEFFDFSGIDTGIAKARTPRLSAAAAAGVIYTNAEATPICGPTRAQIQTGRFSLRTGMGTNAQLATPDFCLPSGEMYIAEAVRNARGYNATLNQALALRQIAGKLHWHSPDGHDTDARDHGWNRGACRTANAGNNPTAGDWDHWIWSRLSWNGPLATPTRTQIGNPSDYVAVDAPISGSNTTYDTDTNWSAGEDARQLVTGANAQSTRPLLLEWCPNPPHDPYQCPPFAYLSALTQSELTTLGIRQGEKFDPDTNPTEASACFYAGIEAVDTQFGYILDNLSSNITSRLMVVVTGDNGTVGDQVTTPFTAQHGKRTVYRQGCIVPFFVQGPLVGAPGRVCTHPVMAVDIFATVLDLMYCERKYTQLGARTIDSRSFFASIRNPDATPARDHFFQHTFVPNGHYPPPGMTTERIAYRDAALTGKLYSYVERFEGGDRTYELYLLRNADGTDADPFENENLNVPGISAEDAAVLADRQAKVAAYLAST